MARNSVAIRLATEGKSTVIRDFNEIGDAGEARVARLRARWESEIEAASRASERAARTEARLASASQPAVQGRIDASTGVSSGAARSRSDIEAFSRELDRAEAEARQLIAAIDPLFAAQQRYGSQVERINALKNVGAISEQRYIQLLQAEDAALEQATLEALRHGQAHATSGNRAVMASQQFQDFFIQVQGGGNILVAASQQLSQLAIVMQGAQGGAGRFAAFMGGPWGTAIFAGTMLLTALVGGHDNAERAAERHRSAEETVAAALRGETVATNELADATRQLREQEDRALQSQTDRINAIRREAQETMNLANQRRQALLVLLQEARQKAAEANQRFMNPSPDQMATGDSGVGQAAAAQTEVARLDALIAEQTKTINDSAGRLANAATEMARQTSTRQGELTRTFDERQSRMEARFRDRLNNPGLSQWRRAGIEGELSRAERALATERERAVQNLQRLEDAERRGRRAVNDNDRPLIRPVAGAVMSQFGADRSRVPLNGRLIPGRRHDGVDFAGHAGDPVLAPESGRVIVGNRPGGLGIFVEIRADSGARDILAHLSSARVNTGDRVTAGQLVGLVGNTGNAAGGPPHLHYQRMVAGQWTDPLRATGSSGAAQAANAAQRETEQETERLQAFVTNLRREMDPAAARAAEIAEQITRVRAAMANPHSGLSQQEGQTWLARLEAHRLDDVLNGLDDIARAEEEAGRRRQEETDQLKRTNVEYDQRAELMRYELSLGGLGNEARERAVRLEQLRLELQRQFGPEHETEIKQILAKAAAEEKLRAEVDRVRAAQEEFRQTGGQVVDELFNVNNWDNWGDAGLRVLRMLLQEFITLAAANPIKNMLFGENNPTLGGVLGQIFGAGAKIAGAFAGGGGDAGTLAWANVFGGKAVGTHNFAGGLTWIAENGPELVSLPRGSRITPAAETRRMLAANDRGPVQHVYNDLRGAVVLEDLYRKMEEGNARAAQQGAEGGFTAVMKAHRDSHGLLFARS